MYPNHSGRGQPGVDRSNVSITHTKRACRVQTEDSSDFTDAVVSLLDVVILYGVAISLC